MRFRFDYTLSEQDYLDFYLFHVLFSRHGRKRFTIFRWVLTIIPLILVLVTANGSGRLSWDMVLRALPFLLLAAAFYFGYKPITKLSVKQSVKRTKKKGDLPFASKVGLWFYDDRFIEVTPGEKTNNRYGDVYAIYAHNSKTLYIYNDAMQAYIMPRSVFATQERYEEFLRFIELKTGKTVIESREWRTK